MPTPPSISYQGNLYYSAEEMNSLVRKHNTIVDNLLKEWLRMVGELSYQIALQKERSNDYDNLLEEHNKLLHDCQLTRLYMDENEYLWQVNLDLHEELERKEFQDARRT